MQGSFESYIDYDIGLTTHPNPKTKKKQNKVVHEIPSVLAILQNFEEPLHREKKC